MPRCQDALRHTGTHSSGGSSGTLWQAARMLAASWGGSSPRWKRMCWSLSQAASISSCSWEHGNSWRASQRREIAACAHGGGGAARWAGWRQRLLGWWDSLGRSQRPPTCIASAAGPEGLAPWHPQGRSAARLLVPSTHLHFNVSRRRGAMHVCSGPVGAASMLRTGRQTTASTALAHP